jgi:signal recognition particle subunit SRP54
MWLAKNQQRKPLLVSTDVNRPAARQQLAVIARATGQSIFEKPESNDPVELAREAFRHAQQTGYDTLLIDTAGRLHIDEELMQELVQIKAETRPAEILFVADAMTGQDAVRSGEEFHRRVGVTGVVLTKMDGDARGGAALSVKAVTGKPIVYASTGEKLDQFERFHPDRMAQRILGMGDVLSFIERAEQSVDEDEARRLEQKLRKNQFTLEDFLDQLKRIRKMGPLTSILGMIPGLAGHQLSKLQVDDRELDRVEAIILSMTPYERRHPEAIKGSRRLRIAKGSGTTVQQVNQLVKQFGEMRKLMRGLSQGKMPDLGALMRGR